MWPVLGGGPLLAVDKRASLRGPLLADASRFNWGRTQIRVDLLTAPRFACPMTTHESRSRLPPARDLIHSQRGALNQSREQTALGPRPDVGTLITRRDFSIIIRMRARLALARGFCLGSLVGRQEGPPLAIERWHLPPVRVGGRRRSWKAANRSRSSTQLIFLP